MAGAADRFRRVSRGFAPQPTVLVICEDSKSGKRYLEDARHYYRINVVVEISHCGNTDPKGIVEAALKRLKNFDRVFCMIDRDTHENFDAAMAIAKDIPNLNVLVSYPCMEFWYLLHFGYTRKGYAPVGKRSPGQQVTNDLRKQQNLENYSKGDTTTLFQQLLPMLPTARKNSQRILAEVDDDGQCNPSTRVHELIAIFEDLADLKAAVN